MLVTQIAQLVNDATRQIVGEDVILTEDLSNVVDVGNEILNSNKLDNYVRNLVNQIGKIVFVDRVYKGNGPNIEMDAWEYGSIVQKISPEMPEATENESWNLQDKQEYNQDVFYQPKVAVKFFNSKTTFEINVSFTELQVKESFQNATQLNAFLSMIKTAVENSFEIKLDALKMRTINHMIASIIENHTATPGVQVVDLSALCEKFFFYRGNINDLIRDAQFLQVFVESLNSFQERITKASTLFNVGGSVRFTPKSEAVTLIHSDVKTALETKLLSYTYNKEYVTPTSHTTVPYWQASGPDFDVLTTTRIQVTTKSGQTIERGGIVAAIFDRRALGVSNLDRRVTTHYNAKAEFFTNFYKMDAGFYNDLNENAIIFVCDAGAPTGTRAQTVLTDGEGVALVDGDGAALAEGDEEFKAKATKAAK